MIRSSNSKLGEYELLRQPDHIARVWHEVEGALGAYWDAFIDAERGQDPIARLSAAIGSHPEREASEGEVCARVFDVAVSTYEKSAEKYRRFFDAAAVEEYYDDPAAFKKTLAKDVPVIAHTLQQRSDELKEWQANFRAARGKDLLEVFANVVGFVDRWCRERPVEAYEAYDSPDDFGLDPLDDDPSMSLQLVVGMGIVSTVMYHLHPDRLPARGRNPLYGLYFLSGRGDFGLPSRSSEFLMVNDLNPVSDGSLVMDQNYWYPYAVFSLYALRVYRWLAARARAVGVELRPERRYVYVERFFAAVCARHHADLRTMRAHERFEVPM